MAASVAEVPIWIDIAAVTLGAVLGGVEAVRSRFDLSGVLVLAIVTGLGGGILRDVLLARDTPVALASPWLLPTAIGAGLLIFLFAHTLLALHGRLTAAVIVVDAMFLGVFAAVGTAKGLSAGLPAASCVLLGVVTGIGGGLLRDVLLGRPPEALRPGALAATAAIIGCSLMVVLVRGLDLTAGVGVASIVVIAGLRILSIWRAWESPVATDLLESARSSRRWPHARTSRYEAGPAEHDEEPTERR